MHYIKFIYANFPLKISLVASPDVDGKIAELMKTIINNKKKDISGSITLNINQLLYNVDSLLYFIHVSNKYIHSDTRNVTIELRSHLWVAD